LIEFFLFVYIMRKEMQDDRISMGIMDMIDDGNGSVEDGKIKDRLCSTL